MARICMIAHSDYIGDSRIRREAEALVARGDTVDLICPWSEDLDGRTSMGGVNLHFARKMHPAGRSSGPIRYLARYATFLLAATARLSRLSRSARYDVVQVHTMPDFLVFAAWPAKRRSASVILDVHDLVPELYESKFGLRSNHPVIRLLVWIERRSIAFADAALAVHLPHRDALVAHGTPVEKLTVVMNSPDLRLWQPPQDEAEIDPSLVVYHGTISKRHGLEFAVRAIDSARRKGVDATLFIAGDGDDAPRIEKLVSELGLEGAVRLNRRFMLPEELLPALRRAQVAVIPLIPDAFTRYMLPVKLLEYAALRIPVIVTRTATIEAYFDDSSVAFVEPEDSESIAGQIADISRNPERRKAMTTNAAKVMERHAWQEERGRYLSVIDDMLRLAQAREADRRRAEVRAR
jgi:glycosyltransferase involved in cell wall biosynthesis